MTGFKNKKNIVVTTTPTSAEIIAVVRARSTGTNCAARSLDVSIVVNFSPVLLLYYLNIISLLVPVNTPAFVIPPLVLEQTPQAIVWFASTQTATSVYPFMVPGIPCSP